MYDGFRTQVDKIKNYLSEAITLGYTNAMGENEQTCLYTT